MVRIRIEDRDGGDEYEVDPNQIRDMTSEELNEDSQTTSWCSAFIHSGSINPADWWLKGRKLEDPDLPVPPGQCVKVIKIYGVFDS